ncbi:hypothetical protein BDZ45DRAFT_742591 [Acephala macrosclerotiorum]|nr:hypothetical protein BDZ45DRAFT_742591 [Acephala macrosclerotiorum]
MFKLFWCSVYFPLYFISLGTCSPYLWTQQELNYVCPHVIPHLYGEAVQAGDCVLRFPITNVSTASALSPATLHSQISGKIPTHYHARYHGLFFIVKGALMFFDQNQTQRLGPLDFASVPVNQNHSFQLLKPDTEVIRPVTPRKFSFYQATGTPYMPPTLTAFPPDKHEEIDPAKLEAATGSFSDYIPTDYQSNFDVVNETSNPSLPCTMAIVRFQMRLRHIS